jgi:hypothetical protein
MNKRTKSRLEIPGFEAVFYKRGVILKRHSLFLEFEKTVFFWDSEEFLEGKQALSWDTSIIVFSFCLSGSLLCPPFGEFTVPCSRSGKEGNICYTNLYAFPRYLAVTKVPLSEQSEKSILR